MHALEPRRLLSLTPVGPETPLIGAEAASHADVATADDGTFHVLTEGSAADAAPIRVQRYAADGAPIGPAVTIDRVAGKYFNHVAIAADADGDAVITYVLAGAETDAGDLFVRRLSKAGVLAAPVLVDTSGPTYDAEYFESADVDMDASGRFFVGWLSTVQRGQHHVYVHAYNADGSSRAAQFDAQSWNTGIGYVDSLDLEVAPDGDSAVYVLHNSFSDSISNVNRGGRVSATASLGTFAVGGTDTPSVALNDDGTFAVAYAIRENLNAEPHRMTSRVQRYDAAGAAVGAAVALGASLVPQGRGVHLADLSERPGGGFLATFVTTTVPAPAAAGSIATYNLYAQEFDAAGTAVAPPVLLDTGAAALHSGGNYLYGEFFQAVTIDSDAVGDAVVTYVEHATPASSAARFRLLDGDDITLVNGSLAILGTAGNDTLRVHRDGNDIIATRGSTTRTFPAADVRFLSVNGLAGDDTITNDTTLPSTMSGGVGNDTVYGGDSPDRLRGEAGNDSVWGRDGNDTIYGDEGVDSLYGNGARDRIDGGANSDHIRGNAGRDRLFGGDGHDKISGGESADWLHGQRGNDALSGDGGNDLIYADNQGRADRDSIDTARGGAGDDLLVARDVRLDQLFGDRGNDTVVADHEDVLTGIETVG